MIRFGQSSRQYILTGSPEFMPEEGPSREQRRQVAALEAMAARREREAAVAQAQMESALRGGGASWGMAEDAADQDAGDDLLEDLDWRVHEAAKGLTDKQTKIADKIRRLERQIAHLETESDRIRVRRSAERVMC